MAQLAAEYVAHGNIPFAENVFQSVMRMNCFSACSENVMVRPSAAWDRTPRAAL
jgi:hypothetical protein